MRDDAATRPDAAVLQARDLVIVRGRRRIYDGLTIGFGIGITALLGPNGAGKTTLLESLARPDRASSGEVLLDGEPVTGTKALSRYLARLGYMPQGWSYYRGFSARESVEYAAWLKGTRSRLLRRAADSALACVDLSAQADLKVRRMSGGMRQRVGLAEATVNDPRVMLLDEPTVGLDPAQRSGFRAFLRPMGRERVVVLSTRLTDDVEALADRVIVVADGVVVFDGTPDLLKRRAVGAHESATPLEAGYLSVIADQAAKEAS